MNANEVLKGAGTGLKGLGQRWVTLYKEAHEYQRSLEAGITSTPTRAQAPGGGSDEVLAMMNVGQRASASMAAPLRTLSLAEFLREVNNQLDDRPHLFVCGQSGAGKTVLVQLVMGTRPGKLVILDPKRPKGWEGPKWGGLPYVSRAKDGSYAPMVRALAKVVSEMDRRYAEQETATEPYEQLTVVLDEAKNSVQECDELAELYRKVVSIGREVGVRLVLLSTTDRARRLGFDGEADSMSSFATVRLGEFALDKCPAVSALGSERYAQAIINHAGGWLGFDNTRTLGYVERMNINTDTAWNKVQYNCQSTSVAADGDDLLDSLLGSGTSSSKNAASEGVGTSSENQFQVVLPQSKALNGGSGNWNQFWTGLSRDEKLAALAALPALSKNAIHEVIGGNKQGVLREIDELRGGS